jgi:hypothetical protein
MDVDGLKFAPSTSSGYCLINSLIHLRSSSSPRVDGGLRLRARQSIHPRPRLHRVPLVPSGAFASPPLASGISRWTTPRGPTSRRSSARAPAAAAFPGPARPGVPVPPRLCRSISRASPWLVVLFSLVRNALRFVVFLLPRSSRREAVLLHLCGRLVFEQ